MITYFYELEIAKPPITTEVLGGIGIFNLEIARLYDLDI